MIQLLRHHEIDHAHWDACLQKARHPLVYAHAWYLDIVCRRQWDALVEVQNGAYVSIFPLPVKTLLGQKRVYQPLFTQQLGPFFTKNSQETRLEPYLALAAAHYPEIQMQLPCPGTDLLELPAPWQTKIRPNYELFLEVSYAELQHGYSTNLRRNLKKASAVQVTIHKVDSIKPLVVLFQQTKGKELPELGHRHYQLLEKLYTRAQQEGVGEAYEVRRQGELLAAAFILNTATRITFLFGASSPVGRRHNAMAFLLDWLLQQEAGSGKTFDFEGSEVPGVAKFYASFGAQPVPYLSLSLKSNRTAVQWTLNVFTSLAKRLR